jgi:hypothetical protein
MNDTNDSASGLVHSTPVSARVSSTRLATTNHEWQEPAFVLAAEEMRNKFQELDICSMIDLFPVVPGMPTIKRGQLAHMVKEVEGEVNMYNPWVSCRQFLIATTT